MAADNITENEEKSAKVATVSITVSQYCVDYCSSVASASLGLAEHIPRDNIDKQKP